MAVAITLNPVYNTIDDFTGKTYAAETQARRQVNQFNTHFLAQEKQLGDMRKAMGEMRFERWRLGYLLPSWP